VNKLETSNLAVNLPKKLNKCGVIRQIKNVLEKLTEFVHFETYQASENLSA
jgi:hypothetical protein